MIIFRDIFRPKIHVLDLGCGTGRIASYLAGDSLLITACDMNLAALRRFKISFQAHQLPGITACDARSLPFADSCFDVIVFGFNGIDFIYPASGRIDAYTEVERCLRPGGFFIFSSHNPIGTALSPRGIFSRSTWAWRLSYVKKSAFRDEYFEDPGGLLLFQVRPALLIREVTQSTCLKFIYAVDRSGRVRSLKLLTLFCAWPYYVFQKVR